MARQIMQFIAELQSSLITGRRGGRVTGRQLFRLREISFPVRTYRRRTLMIAQLLPDPGYYLLYLDEAGEEITDTYHDSLEKGTRPSQVGI